MRVHRGLLAALLVVAMPAHASFDLPQLKQALDGLAARDGGGRLGVAVRDLKDGTSVMLDGASAFAMQSVYKLPIAVALLDRVDRGRISLSRNVHVTQAQRAPGFSPLAREIGPDGIDRSIGQLLEAMMIGSDNTAADMLLDEVGGPAAVQAVLMLKGIHGVRVDRPEKQLQSDWLGLGRWREKLYDEQAREEAIAALPIQRRQAAIDAYLRDPRDTATPRGLLDLLARLAAGEILSAQSTQRLLGLMTASVTGTTKLKAGLPPGWTLAHKTGSSGDRLGIAPAENDVGIATAPDGRRVAIVALLSGSRLAGAAREAVLADVARAAVAALR